MRVNRSRIQRDFYRVGKWNFLVRAKLGDESRMFPFLSQLEPELYSATGRAPYPAALIREYEEITRVACTNVSNRRRVAGEPARDRRPASIASSFAGAGDGGAQGAARDANAENEIFLRARCPAVENASNDGVLPASAAHSQSALSH